MSKDHILKECFNPLVEDYPQRGVVFKSPLLFENHPQFLLKKNLSQQTLTGETQLFKLNALISFLVTAAASRIANITAM